jgi:ATP-dependent DNA helicase RecQ
LPSPPPSPLSAADYELREYLAGWRRETAAKLGVPAFVVMHDTTLEELCRKRPDSLAAIRQVQGFGERKTQTYGPDILKALQKFRDGDRAQPVSKKKTSAPAQETVQFVKAGHSLEEIAKMRGRQLSTVVEQVCSLMESGQLEFQPGWVDAARREKIEAACKQHGVERLKPIKEALPEDITYDEIKLVASGMRRR